MLLIFALMSCGTVNAPTHGANGVVGTAPATPVVIPDFAAVNQDGAPRGKPDLLGHPSVVWYFPAAGTPG
jgi:hypothetical protein